ncbi:MAG: RcnB family protein [Burkholderiaceae bacterium]|jgi:Ni/Co efflux regulator RcnB|nr:RcnB family protein [Burkholderiaceae bacterium]
MTVQKIASLARAALLISSLCGGAFAQPVQPHPGQSAPQSPSLSAQARGYRAGAPSRQEQRPEAMRPYQPRSSPDDYRAGPGAYYRPPIPVAPRAPLRYYRQPGVIVTPSLLIGNVLPDGYSPIDNWGYYNLPAPCCGQYWVQYGQSFLLVSPGGEVLQVFTP